MEFLRKRVQIKLKSTNNYTEPCILNNILPDGVDTSIGVIPLSDIMNIELDNPTDGKIKMMGLGYTR